MHLLAQTKLHVQKTTWDCRQKKDPSGESIREEPINEFFKGNKSSPEAFLCISMCADKTDTSLLEKIVALLKHVCEFSVGATDKRPFPVSTERSTSFIKKPKNVYTQRGKRSL